MFLETFQGIYIYPNRTAVSKIQGGQKDICTHTHMHTHTHTHTHTQYQHHQEASGKEEIKKEDVELGSMSEGKPPLLHYEECWDISPRFTS